MHGIIRTTGSAATWVIIAVLLASCGSFRPESTPSAPDLRVMTFNIRHALGSDGQVDLERIAEVIEQHDPDVVALQEVDSATARSGFVFQAGTLAELTGMYQVFSPAIEWDGGLFGNAILTRRPAVRVPAVNLPGDEERVLMGVSLEPGDTGLPMSITVWNTHLDLDEASRMASVGIIENVVSTHAPCVLAGDLNAQPGSPTMRALTSTMSDATLGFGLKTFPSGAPDRQLDYVLVHPADRWRVVEVTGIDVRGVSDHDAVLVALEFLD